MTWLLEIERRTLWRGRLMRVLAVLVVVLAATWLDGVAFGGLFVGHDQRARVEGRDWYQFLRAVGFWPMWLAVWAMAVLGSSRRGMWRDRGVFALAAAPGLAGIVAEVLKLVFARSRPIHNGVGDGEYVLRGLFAGLWDGSNLGMPSSHAAVAAGGAAALIAWRPGVWPVAGALALGCLVTRLLSGAHFLSDVVVGAMAGYVAWRVVRPGGWGGAGGRMLLP